MECLSGQNTGGGLAPLSLYATKRKLKAFRLQRTGKGAARERTRYARAVRQVVQSVWWYASGGQVQALRVAIGKAKKSDKGKRKPTPTPSKKFDFRFASRFVKPLYSPITPTI